MATYTNPVAATSPVYSPPLRSKGTATLWNSVALATGDMTLNNTIPIGYLPAGAVVHDVVLTLTDIDSGTACVVAVGDAGSAARFIQGSTAGQTATTVRAGNNATSAATFAAHTAYTGPTLIYMTFTTAPGTPVAGTMKAYVQYTVE